MNKDQIKGNTKEAKGKVKEATGDMTNNQSLKYKGQLERLVGKAQASYGDAKHKRNKNR